MDPQWRVEKRYHGSHDPCPPKPRVYIVPPNQYVTFQPQALKQWSPREAIRQGVLWPELCSPYAPPEKAVRS